MSRHDLILGIDGGGTSTVAWLASASIHDVLGVGTAGPSNQRAVGPQTAIANLDNAVQDAFNRAGIERQTVRAACFGLAGVDRPSDRAVVLRWADEQRISERIRVVNDAVPLLYAENGDGTGVALIAGTGSLAWGRTNDGRIGRAGGWGYLLGDEGSAYAVGLSGLQAIIRHVDGRGPATGLSEAVLHHLSISQPSEIVSAVYGSEIPRGVIAGLAPVVFTQAELADQVACDIIRFQATELASMVTSVARRLGMSDGLSLAMTGSVLLNQTAYRNEIRRSLNVQGLIIHRCILVEDAVSGAVAVARSMMMESGGLN